MPYLKFVVVVDYHSTVSVCLSVGVIKAVGEGYAIKSREMTDNFIYPLVQKD